MFSKIPTNLPPQMGFKLVKQTCISGDITRARQLFDKITEPDLPTWTVLISAYTQHGYPKEAIELYNALKSCKLKPDSTALLSVVKACASLGDPVKAKQVHDDVIRFGCRSDLKVGNAVIDMYAKCKCVEGARKAFDDLFPKDVASWTSMVKGYVSCGMPREGLLALGEMVHSGVRPNAWTLSSVLPACSALKDLYRGREIHGFVVRNGMVEHEFVNSAVVNMYASCSSIRRAERVFCHMTFRDVVLWNTLLTAYFANRECENGLALFDRMRYEGIGFDNATWNVVIGGCVQNGLNQQALEVLGDMQRMCHKPNQITITNVLPACTNLESLRGGKEIHAYMLRHFFVKDTTAATALVCMYAKCGELEHSHRVFNMMSTKDIVAWNTMIIANSMHGNGEEALRLFHKMLAAGLKPNSVTFTGVLSSCSHSQLVDEGLLVFYSMSKDYSVEPDAEHYSCMVDVLSRAGRLNEAYDFIQKMHIEPTPSAWGALLGACRVFKNVELGRIAANRLFEIEPDNPGNYVQLFNILVTAKLWSEAMQVRKLMRDRGIKKAPGCSWVQVGNKIHTFVVGDKSNEQSDDIQRFLKKLGDKMRMDGYFPNTEFVLQDIHDDEKEEVLCNHSEKLAVAFGILNRKGESSIRVFKNLRICGDCHNAIKFISKIVGVKIIVRDSLRFHHFRDGHCSCRDFW